jgi:uncharacterized protein YcfL
VKKILLVLLSSVLVVGCASGRAIVRLECPKPPIMLKVRVQNGTVSGKDLTNAIENNQRLWQHLHLLQKLGCKTGR